MYKAILSPFSFNGADCTDMKHCLSLCIRDVNCMAINSRKTGFHLSKRVDAIKVLVPGLIGDIDTRLSEVDTDEL